MFNWFRKALDRMVHTQPSWIYDLLPRTKFDYKKEVGHGYGSSVIMAPINWIGRTFPEAELVIDKEKGDETETITDHDLLRLIDRPNAFYSGASLWKATIASRILAGNAYWIKVRNSVGAVIELWYTPHWMIGPAWPTDGSVFISHYLYKPAGIATGKGIKLDVEDVVHFRAGIEPRNPRLGESPIYPILREIFSDDEAANFGASMLRNMGVMGVIVSPKTAGKSASGADALATKERLGQQFTGDKRGEFMVMTSPTEVTQFGFSPEQMDISALRNISEERVTAQLGLPAAVVGFGTGLQQTKVGATMKEMVKLAWTGCVIPMQRELGSELERSLLPDFEPDPKRFSVRFNHANVEALQESQNEKVDRLDKGIRGGWVEVAEGRDAIGLEVRPADHIFLRQLSTLEIPSGKSVTIEKVLETRKQLINGYDIKATTPLLPIDLPPRRRIDQAQRRLVAAIEREHGVLSDVFEKELTRFFDGMGKDAASVAREVLSNGDPSVETALIAEQLNLPVAQNKLREVGAKHYLRVGEQTFGTVNSIMGLEVLMPDPVAKEIMAAGGQRLGLVDLDKQARARLFRELTEGREAGEGIPQLVARIRDRIPAGRWNDVATRARIIARTETKHAQRTSVLEAYKASNVVTHVIVVDDRLGFGDDDCTFWAGREVTIAEAQALGASEHPNGTRDFVPIIARPS